MTKNHLSIQHFSSDWRLDFRQLISEPVNKIARQKIPPIPLLHDLVRPPPDPRLRDF